LNISHEQEQFSNAEPAKSGSSAQLPLVSVIVVNYNYGRFLDEAVESIFTQTYPEIECIVVDNASTDNSAEVLCGIEARYPQAKIIWRATNDGQTPASLDGLAAAAGAYVIFLDADDFLLPKCIETHVLVHLSMRVHIGFTSVDMLQVADGQVVVSTGEDFNRYVRRGKGIRPDLVRPYQHPYSAPCPSETSGRSIAGKIHYVAPLSNQWVWSPTSGNCYRRDALLLFSDNEALAHLRTGTDMYFAQGIGCLCGSVLIDEPLFVYRIHGDNIFSRRAQLNRVLCYQPGGHGDNNDKARLILIDHLIAKADRFVMNYVLTLNFLVILKRLDFGSSDPELPRWARRSRVARQLVEHFQTIAPILGRLETKLLMVFVGVPWRVIWRATLK
jgi:glycosyltransferase involved in cell wall biosynthesis